MNLIAEITSKAAALPLQQQREALAVIEQLLETSESQRTQDESATRGGLPPLKGATAAQHKTPVTLVEIKAARREIWGKFYSGDEPK